MTSTPWNILDVIRRGAQEIEQDIADGLVPADVRSFSDLHDYVDANGYGGMYDPPIDMSRSEYLAFCNAADGALHHWLAAGRPNWFGAPEN